MYLSFTPCNELKYCLKSLDHKNFRGDLLAARLVPAALLRGCLQQTDWSRDEHHTAAPTTPCHPSVTLTGGRLSPHHAPMPACLQDDGSA